MFNLVRKITSGAVVSTLAGSGLAGSTNGTGTTARFNNPLGVTVDSSGNLYVRDSSNHLIRKITSGGVVTTLAGSAGVCGSTDAIGVTPSSFGFCTPAGVAVDSSGKLYVADKSNNKIRKIAK